MPPDAQAPDEFARRAFADPDFVARYHHGPPRFVPGLEALHRMAGILLAEAAPPNARVLVLGAGGGLEIKALAEAQPGWTFVGVDPSRPMLELARRTLGPLAGRTELIEGTIDVAPPAPLFDAATCLLTLHFLDAAERRRTAAAIHDRLRPGAPFVCAHGSFPQEPEGRRTWVSRYAAFALGSGASPPDVERAREGLDNGVHLLDPGEDEAILRAAGFADATLFYAAFTWRGWIGHAGTTPLRVGVA